MCPACYQDGGSLLHCLSTLTSASEAVYFCCTGLGVTSTGRYPASCPVKPGLSSSAAFRSGSRDHLSYLLIYHIKSLYYPHYGMCNHFNRLRRGLHKVVRISPFPVAGARDVQPF